MPERSQENVTGINGILHASLIVSDVERSLAFYCGVLGLTIDVSRPDLGFAGAWLDVGAQQIHLLAVDNPDPVCGRPEHAGRDRHTAMAVKDIAQLRQKLDAAAIAYTLSRSGRKALFCRDPDGNGLEFIEG